MLPTAVLLTAGHFPDMLLPLGQNVLKAVTTVMAPWLDEDFLAATCPEYGRCLGAEKWVAELLLLLRLSYDGLLLLTAATRRVP